MAPAFESRDDCRHEKHAVPVGTNAAVYDRLLAATHRHCRVASNPEFLKEGTAIEDLRSPIA